MPTTLSTSVQTSGRDSSRHTSPVGLEASIGFETSSFRGGKEEDLVEWVRSEVPESFFADSSAESVSAAFTEVMLWVQQSTQFYDRAKAKFATEADGWLVAYSMVHDRVVVTNEQPRPDSRNRVLLPDVCRQFNVERKDTFLMLRELSIQFGLIGQK